MEQRILELEIQVKELQDKLNKYGKLLKDFAKFRIGMNKKLETMTKVIDLKEKQI